MASLWAERCHWGHGQPNYPNAPFDQIGQNLYITNADILDIDSGIQVFLEGKHVIKIHILP